MAKSKSPKRKNLEPTETEAQPDQVEVKKKKKKVDKEESPEQTPQDAAPANDKETKKEKKQKKKKVAESEIPDQTCPPEEETPGSESEEVLNPDEERVLQRKMKKILKKEEKERLKVEGKTSEKTEASVTPASQQALDYLTCWSDQRDVWKFQKTRQTWLLQNLFDPDMIPDDKFSIMLEYMEGLKGGAKDTTVKKALVLVESGQDQTDAAILQRAQRAKEVIQVLT